MKKLLSLLLVLLMVTSAFVACVGDKTPKADVVIAYESNDSFAQLLKIALEAKTGESISVVKKGNEGKSFVIDADYTLDPAYATYGWKNDGKLTFFKGAIAELDMIVDELVKKVTTLESITTLAGSEFEAEAERNIYNNTEGISTSVNAISNALKNDIISTSTKYDSSNISGTIYYISNNGNDNNDGKSESTAFATLEKLKSVKLNAGDAVLFECGSLFRGEVKTVEGVTYGNYGSGTKPIILQSARNYAEGNLWELEDASKNIWKLTVFVKDPGIVVFNAHQDAVDYVEEDTALRIWDRCDDDGKPQTTTPGYQLLENSTVDKSYYWGTKTTTPSNFNPQPSESSGYYLYLKSEKDPNTFDSIEIGEDKPIFDVDVCNNVTIDGFILKYCGGHTVSANGVVNTGLTVKNCIFAYGGGSLGNNSRMRGTRYGNAIQIFGGCDNFTVQNNWIYQFFDTGITFQYHYSGSEKPKMTNVDISRNLVEKCFWNLEWWISPQSSASLKNPEVANIHVYENIIRDGFDSWGTTQHGSPKGGATLSAYFGTTNVSNVVYENNIFDKTFCSDDPDLITRMLTVSFYGGNSYVEYTNNLFIQSEGQLIGKITMPNGQAREYYGTASDIERLQKNVQGALDDNFFCVIPK